MNIAFRRKIIVDVNRKVLPQVGRVQRGQWIWLNGMNARVVNVANGFITVLRFDRYAKRADFLMYA